MRFISSGKSKTAGCFHFFERIFSWGRKSSLNDVNLENKYAVADSHLYCAHRGQITAPPNETKPPAAIR